jgi:hypothetical protein
MPRPAGTHFAIAAAFLLALACHVNAEDRQIEALSQYLDHPTEANAQRAILGLSSGSWSVDLAPADLLLMRNQVVAGSEGALRLTLALLPMSSGGSLESLIALAAAAIRPQPALFLKVVQASGLDPRTLESILLMPGLEYVDRPAARRHELDMRRRAIAGATRPESKAARDFCLKVLDRELGR